MNSKSNRIKDHSRLVLALLGGSYVGGNKTFRRKAEWPRLAGFT